MPDAPLYHLGFGADDLEAGTTIALLCGDPARSAWIATDRLGDGRQLAAHRGLDAFAAHLPDGRPVVCATSGMGAPSTSIVVNELARVGITTIVRVGTTGSIQPFVHCGDVVVASGALTRQGAARDIAPDEYPAVADPHLVVALEAAAEALGVPHHVGIVASLDTFYEGQERTTTSANPHLLHHLVGSTDELRDLRVLCHEMEAGTLLKMGSVYGLSTAAVLAVIDEHGVEERPDEAVVAAAVPQAVEVALAGLARLAP